MALGLASLFSWLGGPEQVVHLETLSFSLCKMGRWLQPL